MPNKGKIPKNNRFTTNKNNINQGEIDSEIKLLNVPTINSAPRLSERVEQMAADPNKNQNQTTCNVHGEDTEISTTTTSNNISPELYRTNEIKSTSNFIYSRTRSSLDSPITQVTCRTTKRRFLDTQLKSTLLTTEQVNKYVDNCENTIEEDSPSEVAFSIAEKQLRDVQTQFIRRCENRRADSATNKMKRSYTFISLVENNNCRLVLHDNQCLSSLPKNLPFQSVKILKDSVREVFDKSLDFLDIQFTNFKLPENQMDLKKGIALTYQKHKDHQDCRTEIWIKQVHELFKQSSNNNTTADIQEIKKRTAEFKACEGKKFLALTAKNKSELTNEIKRREETIEKLTKRNQEHEKQLNQNISVSNKNDEILTTNKKKINEMKEKIVQLKNQTEDLNKAKPNMEECDELNSKEITQLEKEIENSANLINELNTELSQKSAIPKVPTKISEIEFLKEKLEISEQNLAFLKKQCKKSKDLCKLQSQHIKVLRENVADLRDELKTLESEQSELNSSISMRKTELKSRKQIFSQFRINVTQKLRKSKFLDQRIEKQEKLKKQIAEILIEKDKEIVKLDNRIAQLKSELKLQRKCNLLTTDKEITGHVLADQKCKHSTKNRRSKRSKKLKDKSYDENKNI